MVRIAAVLCLIVLAASGCGQGAAGHVVGPPSARVYPVEASIGNSRNGPWKPIANGWYEPQTGYWSSSFAGHPSWQSAYIGTRYWSRDDHDLLVEVTGSPGDLARDAEPSAFEAPEVAVAESWLRPDPALGRSHKGITRIGGSGGDTVLIAAFDSGSDTQQATIYLKTVIHAPVSAQDAAGKGAFPAPTGTPDELRRATTPGTKSSYGLHAFWLGRSALGAPVQSASEQSNSAKARKADFALHSSEYEVVYGGTGTPPLRQLTVESTPASEKVVGVNEDVEVPVTWHAVTLADGEPAQAMVLQKASVYVKTSSTLVHVTMGAWDGNENCTQMLAAVRALVPVGYTGANRAVVPQSVCVQPPVGLIGAPRFVKPPSPYPAVTGAHKAQILYDCAQVMGEFDGDTLYKASDCGPLAHVSPYCYHFARPTGLWGLHFDYMAVDIVPSGAGGCHVRAATAVYADPSEAAETQLLFVTSTPICGPVETQSGDEVPVESLQAILRGRYAATCH